MALCAGAAWYNSAWIEPPLIGIASTFAMLLAVYGLMRRIALVPRIFGLVVLILLGFSAGALSGKLAVMRTAVPTIAAPTGPVMLEGWVEDVESAKRGVRLRLLVHAIDGLPASQTPDHVRLTHTNSLEVESGRFVRCWSVLRPPPAPVIEGDYAFHRQAFFERLGGVGYVQGRCRGGTLGKPAGLADQARLKVAEWRRQLAHYVYQAAGERAGGFAAAVASGDRSFIDSADQDALRGSGLAHLLAISGLHMGIVGGLIYLMVWRGLALIEPLALRIAVQKPAALAALCASGAYLVLSGASISTQRAFIMALVLFGAILFDRAALSLRSLAIAMIAVVILAPWSVLTPGFQMSFAATGALIATYEAWQRRRRQDGQMGRRSPAFWAKSLFMTSLVSSLATAPFAIYHFERFAGLGLIANLFAMPMISLVSAPLAGASLVLSPFGLSGVPLRLFGYSLEWVLWVGHVFSNLAPDEVSQSIPMPAGALAFLSLAMVLAMMCQGWQWRAALFSVFSLAGALLWAMTPQAGI
ncbi:MAG: ComEC/Rec2 family competence protein, partial [Pseudomonadota bacterium]